MKKAILGTAFVMLLMVGVLNISHINTATDNSVTVCDSGGDPNYNICPRSI